MSIKTKKPIYSNIPETLSIPVTIEYDGYFVISDNEINMYGVGDTVVEAEEDYKSIVLSYFEDLEENEYKLDGHLKGHLDYLREKLSDYIRNDSNKTIKIEPTTTGSTALKCGHETHWYSVVPNADIALTYLSWQTTTNVW